MENFKWFISGFVAGEGYFSVICPTINKPHSEFGIKLASDDKKILEDIKKTFGCGHLRFEKNSKKDAYRFSVIKIKDIIEKIIPFFDEYSFFSARKKESYEKWKVATRMIYNKEHLTDEGNKIVKFLSKRINM